jgi:hypothetical protein
MFHRRTPRWSLRITRVDQPRSIAREDRQHGIEHIAHHLLEVIRPLDGAVDPVHAFQEPEMSLALLLCPLAFRHIHHGAYQFSGITGGVEHRMAYCVDVSHRAVGKNDSAIQFVVRPLADGSLEDVGGPGLIVRMHPLAKCVE